MSDTKPKVIRKHGLAPARKLIDDRLKQVMDAKIKIQSGPGADRVETDHNGVITKTPTSLCIMEACSYILGWDGEPGHNVDDGPPCTSETITSLMIELNDHAEVSNRARAQLKQLIPDVINTAPLIWATYKDKDCLRDPKTKKCVHDEDGKIVFPERLSTNTTDPDYVDAEEQRENMINDFMNDQPKKNGRFGDLVDRDKGDVPISKWIVLIRELAAVAKFDAANNETQKDFSTPAVDIPDRQDLPVDPSDPEGAA